ncbi:S46 family peptidase [Phocaeicola coprocola]|uniref:S46 family peptidase n=1 Tax=Phocaeicola coprocola TaxID=310298 RepID=UPI001C391D8B|nr:S46 family peptidase [Phocaeicola coprocola]MBV3867373.1 S46 family peptidase [Phocaeicola coprocola]MBV4008532.1 S46 family peptidase [Phocaeicola coprocola]MBV4033097.1 S46 family peptidase [Phocaeicola coprocola]MBV4039653.1 S46 family peptidase [Phocaeicola coprocola]MBV4061233.1 S46 family peptidase [Phocaeicola coprocola]
MKKTILFSMLAACSLAGYADEGMWMLTDLKKQNAAVMQDLGLDISIDKVYCPDSISLKDAVVHFGGGCTGEVISAEGLVLTNHHCGYQYIQQHSAVEHDYLTDGFWAMSREQELPCEGLTITFIDRILDVTDYVQEQLKKDEDPEGLNYLSPSYLSTVAKRFAKKENIKTDDFTVLELKPFYGANKYYLFVKTVYKDIRMVGAPPSSIGKFGADTDNWMWPRHCGDFSIFRIYASKDGKPANYAADNVPLKVKKHLAINMNGIKEGDFTFVMGFPGRNWRYMISDEVEERMQTTNFMRDTVRGVRLRVLGEEMAKDAKTRIQYAAKYASSANYWKNAIGMNEGLVSLKVLDRKKDEQKRLLAFGDETGNESYRQAYESIKQIVAKRHDAVYHQQAIYEALMLGTEFSKIPDTDKLLEALEKNDKKGVKAAITALQEQGKKFFNKDYSTVVDRKVSKQLLALYAQLIPAGQRISIFKVIDGQFAGSTDAFVDACFDSSIFRSSKALAAFLQNPSADKLKKDLMVQYAKSVKEGYKATDEAMKAETNAYNRAHKTWVAGMLALKQKEGKAIYPDANSTLRLTYGKIGSYEPADGKEYLYYTTLKGVMEKEDPENPEFVVSPKLKELYEKKDFGPYAMADGRMPVCFVTATDNTGGNSGSPVFNSKGELIGVGFDRNYEGLTGDIAYNPQLQRAACVDIRYVLFVIDKYAGAKHLIDELTIVR